MPCHVASLSDTPCHVARRGAADAQQRRAAEEFRAGVLLGASASGSTGRDSGSEDEEADSGARGSAKLQFSIKVGALGHQ